MFYNLNTLYLKVKFSFFFQWFFGTRVVRSIYRECSYHKILKTKSFRFRIWTSCAKKWWRKSVHINRDDFQIIKSEILFFFDFQIQIGGKSWTVAKTAITNFLHFKNREKTSFGIIKLERIVEILEGEGKTWRVGKETLK